MENAYRFQSFARIAKKSTVEAATLGRGAAKTVGRIVGSDALDAMMVLAIDGVMRFGRLKLVT
jgi:hypothetical protein